MKREKTHLRRNAALAKARLVTGFWQEDHKKANLENINNLNGEDEQLYLRVATVLKTCGGNPLTQVLDYEYMGGLDDASRQRYILNMSARVQKSVERYNQVC